MGNFDSPVVKKKKKSLHPEVVYFCQQSKQTNAKENNVEMHTPVSGWVVLCLQSGVLKGVR